MTPIYPRFLLALLAVVMALSGCAGGAAGPNISDYVTTCMFETNARGSFAWSDGDRTVSGTGASEADTAAMNACIRREAAADGVDLDAPVPAAGPRQTVEVEAGPGGSVTETFTYGTPPATTAPEAMRVRASGEGGICRLQMVGGTGYACR